MRRRCAAAALRGAAARLRRRVVARCCRCAARGCCPPQQTARCMCSKLPPPPPLPPRARASRCRRRARDLRGAPPRSAEYKVPDEFNDETSKWHRAGRRVACLPCTACACLRPLLTRTRHTSRLQPLRVRRPHRWVAACASSDAHRAVHRSLRCNALPLLTPAAPRPARPRAQRAHAQPALPGLVRHVDGERQVRKRKCVPRAIVSSLAQVRPADERRCALHPHRASALREADQEAGGEDAQDSGER
jgi:hypothetical protein